MRRLFALACLALAGCAYGAGDPVAVAEHLDSFGPAGRPAGRWETRRGPRAFDGERALCDGWDRDGCYGGTLHRELDRYAESALRYGEFAGVDGKRIRFAYVPDPAPVASLVIVPGRAESYVKYVEVLYDLRDLGFDVYVIDHRGQGRSERLLSDPQKGYVDDFRDYAADLATFVDRAVPRHRPAFALAHSMGGAILALTLLDHPDRFDAVVFSSPMWEVNFEGSGLSESAASWLAWAAWNRWYAYGQGPYDPNEPFEGNDVTRSEARFEMRRWLYNADVSIRLGGPTYGWIGRAIEATEEVRARAGELAVPMRVLSAGDDALVVSARHADVCARAAECELRTFPGARHELLMEKDDVRSEALWSALELFREHVP